MGENKLVTSVMKHRTGVVNPCNLKLVEVHLVGPLQNKGAHTMKKKLYHLFGGRRVGRNDKVLMQTGRYHHVLRPLVHEHTDILLDAH